MKTKIAVIGATGNVGRKIVELLIARQSCHPNQLRLFASPKSAGSKLRFGTTEFTIEDLAQYDFKDCSIALFATDSDISKIYVPKALEAGSKAIDSSSLYRLDPKIPLIAPPVNSHLITKQQNLYAAPNCIACPISVVLKPLHDYAVVKRVIASTYQSTSGAGKEPMDELQQQTKSLCNGEKYAPRLFPRQIAFNVIPQIDRFLEDGYSHEETKIIKEVHKIISPTIKITTTSVRVPVLIGHSISLSIEFEKSIDLKQIKDLLLKSPGIKLSENHYTTPLEAEGKDDIYVGRLRRDPTIAEGICLWMAFDNLRRGAALDTVEIAEKLIQLKF